MSTAAADVKPCSTLSERKEAIAPAERTAVSENLRGEELRGGELRRVARTEAERRHQQQEGAHHHREAHDGVDVRLHPVRVRVDDVARRVGDEERDERERADRHVARAAHRCVDGQRRERGVQAVDRRQLGEHRVRDALRDEDDADGEAGDEVGAQQRPRVPRHPLDRREAPPQRRWRRAQRAAEPRADGGVVVLREPGQSRERCPCARVLELALEVLLRAQRLVLAVAKLVEVRERVRKLRCCELRHLQGHGRVERVRVERRALLQGRHGLQTQRRVVASQRSRGSRSHSQHTPRGVNDPASGRPAGGVPAVLVVGGA